MNILILGDVVGSTGREQIKSQLEKLINEKQIDFVVINGENAAEDGKGITESIAQEFFNCGADVITSGNHIWDKTGTTDFIERENRLLRPENLAKGSPGNGFGIYKTKNKKYKVAVINLMGNVYMRKTEDVFKCAENLRDRIRLKENADFIIIDFHGEITSEKNAIGHFFDGKATAVVGTHTHIPTADSRILNDGTAYQTDIGMCGDYNSVIGMNKENSILKFLGDKNSKKHFPAEGEATLSGIIVKADKDTGLALEIKRYIKGGVFKN